MLVLGHTYISFTVLCVLLFSTLWMVILLFGLCLCFWMIWICCDYLCWMLWICFLVIIMDYMDFLMLMDIFFTNELMLLFLMIDRGSFYSFILFDDEGRE